jgi:hypothetical protein
VRNFPPKYTDIQLQAILDTPIQLPDNMNAQDFTSDIRDNTKIKWRVNHSLFTKKSLPYLVDPGTFRKWKTFKSLNWLIAVAIIAFAIWSKDYWVLFFLILYPFLIITFDHWIFIFNMTLFIGAKFLFKINIPHFWFFVIFICVGYLLNKAINEMIEKAILKQALSDLVTFWKYYSNRMIWMDETALNDEYQKLTEKYSELRR